MRLRHTAEYSAAVGMMIVSALIFLVLIAVTPYTPISKQYFLLRSFALYGAVVCLIPWPLLKFWAERRFRQTAADRAPNASAARHQPDRTLTLAPGEALRIPSPPLRAQARWQGGLSITFVVLVLEGFICYQAPNVGLQLASWVYGLLASWGILAANPLATSFIAPVPLAQWAVVATPLVASALFLVGQILLRYAHFRELLVADDHGLTWRAPLRQTRFVAWGDVQRFVLRSNYPPYGVLGQEATISFDAPLPPGLATPTLSIDDTVQPPSQRPSQAKMANDAYQDAAERLVATIVARSGRPLLLAEGLRGRDYTAEDVATAPLAGAGTLRQTLPTLADGFPIDDMLVAQTKLPWRAFFRLSIRWAWVTPVAFLSLLFVMSPSTLLPPAILALSGYTSIIGCCVGFWLMGVLLFPVMQSQRYRNLHPIVEANAQGIVLRGYNNNLIARADWGDIRAWAVAPLAPLTPKAPSGGGRGGADGASALDDIRPGRQFIVVTDDDKSLVWDEPADGELDHPPGATPDVRRAAYREVMADLHTLIAARTGLPLRELPTM